MVDITAHHRKSGHYIAAKNSFITLGVIAMPPSELRGIHGNNSCIFGTDNISIRNRYYTRQQNVYGITRFNTGS